MTTPAQQVEEIVQQMIKQLRPRLAAMIQRSPTTEGFGEVSVKVQVQRNAPVTWDVNDRTVFKAGC